MHACIVHAECAPCTPAARNGVRQRSGGAAREAARAVAACARAARGVASRSGPARHCVCAHMRQAPLAVAGRVRCARLPGKLHQRVFVLAGLRVP